MLTRRDFLRLTAFAGGYLTFSGMNDFARTLAYAEEAKGAQTKVVLIKTEDRAEGVSDAIRLLRLNSLKGKNIILKPNFNSSDPFPGSTHNDTLRALITNLGEMGAKNITIADRSGMGVTRQVMEQKGIIALSQQMGFETVTLDGLPKEKWVDFQLKDSHWKRGVSFPKLFVEAEAIVQTCCLKTHGFGGHFTLSLKNSVGMVAKFSPKDNYNYMGELHSSPHQRRMIAEINQLYTPDLILLDGIEAFVDGGPHIGQKASPGVILAGTDRIAVDAVGVAILRLMGTNAIVSQGEIFEQEQIARATELGIGVSAPEQIQLVAPDKESYQFALKVAAVLKTGVPSSVNPMGKLPVTWGQIK